MFTEKSPKGMNNLLYKSLLDVGAGKVKNYFGEKIAMYFAFLSFYTKILISLSVVGIALFIVHIFSSESSSLYRWSSLGFGAFHIIWITVFYEKWT